jgi:hypothetical protein
MRAKFAGFASLLMALALTACVSNSAKLNEVRIGMPKSEVVGVLGQPDSTSGQANIEYLTYYLTNDAYGRQEPYMVRLVDAKVESFGRFIQLLDVYNRPVNGFRPVGMGAIMPYAVNTEIAQQLEHLKALKDAGSLTDVEYQQAKQKLLETP